jgi:putative intracellular protease/amidase
MNELSVSYKMTLSLVGNVPGPIASNIPRNLMSIAGSGADYGYVISSSTVATHTCVDAPALDVLLVPGGYGGFSLMQRIEDFITNRFPQLDYLISVCTGSMHLARTGVLNGKRATTNKAAWSIVSA